MQMKIGRSILVTTSETLISSHSLPHFNIACSENYYESFRAFFAEKISQLGISKTLEKYLFSSGANHESPGGTGPVMLARFYSGVIHPFIHSGHIEFGMPGMLAEGQSDVLEMARMGVFSTNVDTI